MSLGIQEIHLVLSLLEYQVVLLDLVDQVLHVVQVILRYHLCLVVHFHHVLHVGLEVRADQVDLRIDKLDGKVFCLYESLCGRTQIVSLNSTP